jgi:hypothetical protein
MIQNIVDDSDDERNGPIVICSENNSDVEFCH